MKEHGPVVPLVQRCIEPGHWVIEGRDVRAVYMGRSRHMAFWTVEGSDDPFGTLDEARTWIRGQMA